MFCVGPLTVLGSINDGLGNGIDQLALKATLDGFAAVAFAASLGWGVAASALTVLVVQGSLTLLGVLLGDVLSDAQIAALSRHRRPAAGRGGAAALADPSGAGR